MLSHSQNEPFKFTIKTLKRLVDSNSVEKEQHQLKSCLKSISQISKLGEILKLALNSESFEQLSQIVGRVHFVQFGQMENEKNVKSYENWGVSPQKSGQRNKERVLKHVKKQDLTPSTKKSRVLSSPTMGQLIEELVDNLQKFDKIKQNSKRVQLLIGQVHEAIFTPDVSEPQMLEEMCLQRMWKELSQFGPQQMQMGLGEALSGSKQELVELLQQIQIIYKFMQATKTTSHQIFNLLEPKSSSETDQQSHDSYNLEAITKKSNHPSEQRSLLTQVLRDSSQKSNLQLPEHQYISHVVLRPRFKEYSQNETSAHLDQEFKFSYKSAKPYEKPYNKLIRSEMDYYDGENNENDDTVALPIRRKQVKIKRSEMSCSRCEIF